MHQERRFEGAIMDYNGVINLLLRKLRCEVPWNLVMCAVTIIVPVFNLSHSLDYAAMVEFV